MHASGAQRSDEGVVGEIRDVLVIEDLASLAQQREGLGREFEAGDMRARRGVRRIARPAVGDEIFDLPQVLVSGGFEPRALGCRSRDAGQLAHG